MSFPEWIKNQRLAGGYETQEALADAAKVSQQLVSRLESTGRISLSSLKRVCKTLTLDLHEAASRMAVHQIDDLSEPTSAVAP